MEAGEGTAGDGDEQDREHHAGLGGEAGEHRGGHRGLAVDAEDDDAEDGADDHDEHHDGGEVVTRLLERLDGHGAGEDQVDHDNGDPGVGVETQRGGHADGEHGNDHDDGDDELGDALEVELVAGPAEGDGHEREEDRDGARGGGGVVHGVRGLGGLGERAADHRGEGRDDDDAEQPAEQQEQATARLADVLVDELGKRLAVVLQRGVQGAEVVDGTKEDAADEDPQDNRQPAEGHGHDRARDGASTADRAELVRERGKGRGRGEGVAILHTAGGRDGVHINAPLVGKPAPVQHVAAEQHQGRDEHNDDSVHKRSFHSERIMRKKRGAVGFLTRRPLFRPPVSNGRQLSHPF